MSGIRGFPDHNHESPVDFTLAKGYCFQGFILLRLGFGLSDVQHDPAFYFTLFHFVEYGIDIFHFSGMDGRLDFAFYGESNGLLHILAGERWKRGSTGRREVSQKSLS